MSLDYVVAEESGRLSPSALEFQETASFSPVLRRILWRFCRCRVEDLCKQQRDGVEVELKTGRRSLLGLVYALSRVDTRLDAQ